jgi:hypothetical protein
MKKPTFASFAAALLLVGTCANSLALEPHESDPAGPSGSNATFETLTIGGQTLRNVSVYGQTSDMIYLRHAGGLLGLRASELDQDTRRLLGYDLQENKGASDRGAFRFGRGDAGDPVEDLAISIGWGSDPFSSLESGMLAGLGLAMLAISAMVGLLIHLLVSFLLRMICRKAGSEPGLMIWLPFLQVFPLLKAAGMSRRWPFAIVGLSVIGTLLAGVSIELALLISLSSSLLALGLWIAWSIKICVARGKNPAWAVLLLLPGFNLVGLIYLAASE